MKKRLFILTLILSLFLVNGCSFFEQEEPNVENEPQSSMPADTQVTEEPEDERKTEIDITSSPVNVEGYEALSKCMYDVINNGNEDTITLYTSAQRDMTGEMLWDDTQEWVLQVETDNGVYDLYDERIHGRAYLNVSDYYNDATEQKVISLYIAGKSFNEIREYYFEEGKFIEEIAYTTDDNAKEGIGTLYSSIPDYE